VPHGDGAPNTGAYENSPAFPASNACNATLVPGAGWFVRAKLFWPASGFFAVTFHTYSRPIPSPVKYLRPARDTCEQCHWPQTFFSGRQNSSLRPITKTMRKNTPMTTALVMKNRRFGAPSGFLWASTGKAFGTMGSRIHYISTDERRQVIPVVLLHG